VVCRPAAIVRGRQRLNDELSELLAAGQQREHCDGLLRQYFPKKTDLSLHTEAQVLKVVAELNSRPREVLNWQTPLEVFSAASVAMIA
jgi:IS30 family transposase